MGRHELEYPKEAVNQVRRLGERGVYALKTIHSLVNSTQILHVSFTPPDSPFPVTLPMIGQMGSFDRPSSDIGDPLELYLHGYVSSRIMNLTRRVPAPTGTGGGASAKPGLPICVAASHCDGLVLALSAFSHSYNYRSAILFGHATVVEDAAEKLYAMELITNSVVPDRWRNTRLPPNNAEMQSTSILKVKIASGSAKIRNGNCHDEQADMQSQEAVDRIWTGVLPVHQVIGEPVVGSYNKVDAPAYLTEFIQDFNSEQKDLSVNAAQEKA